VALNHRRALAMVLVSASFSLASALLVATPVHAFECSYYGRLKVCIDVPSGSFSIFDPSDGAQITGVCGSGANWSRSWNDAFVHSLYYRLCGARLRGY